jgi:dsDNA-specific endonuclease/ATPase MutS2
LIEGVGIILLLAHSGLPVPSDEAEISLAEEIHIMSKVIGTQSAGALERTLIGLASIVDSDSKKFVLADELEAITEPEAAAGILAGLLDVAARNSVNSILMVTHIGSSICKKMEFKARVDGIEAKGLDEELELIVDRVPRIGIPARSTPELILKRLEARSVGTKSEVFKSILDRL